MRVEIQVERYGHEYSAMLEADQRVPLNAMLGMVTNMILSAVESDLEPRPKDPFEDTPELAEALQAKGVRAVKDNPQA